MNRWSPIDTIWRSNDGGATWKEIAEQATRVRVGYNGLLGAERATVVGLDAHSVPAAYDDAIHACAGDDRQLDQSVSAAGSKDRGV